MLHCLFFLNKCIKATIKFVGFPNLGLVVQNNRSGWEETNFLLFIHLDNHSQWTQHICTLFATPTPCSAHFTCSTDSGQSWIAFISQSGAEVSFNFDKRWAGNICALTGWWGCEFWRASKSKTCWEIKVHGGHVASRCASVPYINQATRLQQGRPPLNLPVQSSNYPAASTDVKLTPISDRRARDRVRQVCSPLTNCY